MSLDQATLDVMQNSTPTDWSQHDAALQQRNSWDQNRFADDAKLHVRFYRAPVLDEVASKEANRAIFKDAEMIEIMMPGEKNNIIRDLVWAQHIERFPEKYAKFKAGLSQNTGSPLSALPFMTESRVKELEYLNIFTVEQLAGMSDAVKQRFMGAGELAQRAQKWLDGMKSTDQLRAEVESQNKESLDKINKLEQMLQAQAALLAKFEAASAPKDKAA